MATYLGMMCWNPWRYSCSKVGTTTCLRFHTDSSSLLSTGGAGSRHSGMKMMNDSGSLESDSKRSKCVTMDSISSSQKGGLASNDPDTGLNSRMGLIIRSIKHTYKLAAFRTVDRTRAEQPLPSGAKVSVRIRESRRKLPEVAVEWRGETLERHAKVFVQRLEDAEREGALRPVPFARLRPHVGHVALQQAPDARQEPFKLPILEAIVPVQLLLFPKTTATACYNC